MKTTVKVLIASAVVITIVGIISRLTFTPFAGLASRAMIGFSALLLLFAISLEGLK